MINKTIFLVLLGTLTVFPIKSSAQDTPPENPGGFPHLLPIWRLCTANYDGGTGYLTITFSQDITDATLTIYKDGMLVVLDNLTDIQAGSTTAYNLSLFGTGTFSVYIRIGERTYAIFEEEIEE